MRNQRKHPRKKKSILHALCEQGESRPSEQEEENETCFWFKKYQVPGFKSKEFFWQGDRMITSQILTKLIAH